VHKFAVDEQFALLGNCGDNAAMVSKCFPIEILPLRERREDTPVLIYYFGLRHSRPMQKPIKSVPKQAMEALVDAE
jgi:transcriptional regulator with AAA-type ATPase domain